MLFRCTAYSVLRRRIPAGRAIQPVVMPECGPRGKPDADGRFCIMDPAVHLSILPSVEERTRGAFFPVGINPVVNPVDTGQVLLHQICGSTISPVRKAYEDMHKDITPAIGNPRNKIFRNSFLVPAPFLAALPALPAVREVLREMGLGPERNS